MKLMKILIKDALILTMDEQQLYVKGDLLIENDRIIQVGGKAPEGWEADETVSLSGKLIMPGLVNTHGHTPMSLLRGYADDLALQSWLQDYIWPIEAKFTAEDVRYGSLLSIVEMLKGGTTTFVDMYDHTDVIAVAVEEAGIRGCLTRGVIGLCSEEERSAKLANAVKFAREWHGKADGRITTMLSPHAPYTCPPDLLEQFVQASIELNLPIHTHMSETIAEVEQNVRDYGVRPVEHLRRLGVFDRPCLLAHAVHLTDEEIQVLQAYDVRVSHNPGSNLKLASGIARVPDLLRAGVKVSLGTDSSSSNNNLDMFEEIRLAALLHKGVTYDPTVVPALTALKRGTIDGAVSIWLDDVGMLSPGYKADLIAIDIDQPHLIPHTDLVSHIVYSASQKDVTDVWVDGKRLVKDGTCTTLDEERIRFEAARCFARLNG
jgi:5-methylthioadenosine/S-adenosylhomocysteine deaminase